MPLRVVGNDRRAISSGFSDVLDEIDTTSGSSGMADRLGRFSDHHETSLGP
jgi:hypothetical protein